MCSPTERGSPIPAHHVWLSPVVAALVLLSSHCTFAAAPVTGDAAALQLLRDAAATNRQAWTSGELRIRVQRHRDRRTLESLLIWDGSNCYCDLILNEMVQERIPGGHDRREVSTKTDLQTILTQVSTISYFPTLNLAQISDKLVNGYRLLELRPEQAWFSLDGIEPWENLINPDHPRLSSLLSEIEVFRESQDRIVVVRRYNAGGRLRIVGSLKHNGNIVEYQWIPADGGANPSRRQGSYDWVQHPDGRWYVKHMESLAVHSREPERGGPDIIYDTTELLPQRPIDASRFTIDSLTIPDGTVMEVEGPEPKRYRKGTRVMGKGIPQSRLDDLSEILRRKLLRR